VRAILAKLTQDTVHASGNLTATRLLTCPREVAISDFLHPIIDIRKFDSTHTGTLVHEDLARWAGGGKAEQRLTATFLGEKVSVQPDYISADKRYLVEYKYHAEGGQVWAASSPSPRVEYGVQMNLARLGVEQETGKPVFSLQVEEGAMCGKSRKIWDRALPQAWISKEVPIMTEAEMGEVRPLGGEATVRELMEDYKKYMPLLREGGGEKVIAKMPLRGRTMLNKLKCKMCSVQEDCDRLEGIGT
jgi:hypothetical protein